jgi:hypothetical protein
MCASFVQLTKGDDDTIKGTRVDTKCGYYDLET